jgi:hypothetical protein
VEKCVSLSLYCDGPKEMRTEFGMLLQLKERYAFSGNLIYS